MKKKKKKKNKHLYSLYNFKMFAHWEDLKNLSKLQNIIIKKY